MDNMPGIEVITAHPKPSTVLVVEDNPWIQESLKDVLELSGFIVKTANNGQEALAAIQGNGDEPPSLIFLDLMMPVMDGFSFIREMEKTPALAGLPIVVLSAVSYGDFSKSSSVKRVLMKPIWVEHLVETAKEFCAKNKVKSA